MKTEEITKGDLEKNSVFTVKKLDQICKILKDSNFKNVDLEHLHFMLQDLNNTHKDTLGIKLP